MRKFLLSLLLLAFFGVLTFLFSRPAPVRAADCNEGYIRTTQADCEAVCEGGTCTPITGTGGGPGSGGTRYRCDNCPAPEPGTCTTGITMTTARICDDDCASGQCVDDTAGVSRCCLVFSDSSPNSCPNDTTSYPGATECARDCAGSCVNDNSGVRRCCLPPGSTTGGTTPGEGLPEEQECVNIGLGCIPTDPAEFAGWILGWGIGLGTLLAMVFLVIGGVGVATSSGNPENLENAKKQITAAIAGLLFILLSVLVLNTIGGGIIGIPFFQ